MLTCKGKCLKHLAVASATLLVLSTIAAGMADARGGGGRGGGGMRGGGGGGFSRGGGGGGFSGARSAPTGIQRGAGGGNLSGANRANFSGGNRANVSGGNRANVGNGNRANIGNGSGNFSGNTRNVNINADNGWGGGCCGYNHPVAAGMAVAGAAAVTAAAIGSMAYSLPPGCSPYGGYYNCGGTYYQPQYSGSDVTY
ncbi:MAG TPA: hypothetical protein VN175_07695, partial [Rhizomicrobium sp.]|nr:hypothetical protein [Rhizomicrobium sp.]